MTTSTRWIAALPFTSCVTASLLCLATLACSKQPPALGEVVVSIDTNALVPQLIGRLRVDLYDQDGRWFDSRDIARTDPADWPASFSVYTLDENTPRTVLVRARAYLEGHTRDYRGERFDDRLPYVELHVADTLNELCTAPAKLSLGQDLTLRAGRRPLTGNLPGLLPAEAPSGTAAPCTVPIQGGSVAAQLDISEAGDYRLKATLLNAELFGSDTSVAIRKDCREPLSQVACGDNYFTSAQGYYQTAYSLATLVTHLDPGSYSVIASGYYPNPADFRLRADLLANANQPPSPPASSATVGNLPRLLVNDVDDITPAEEPQPLVTIDRLALLKLVPGQKQLAPILLNMACSGLMAKLSKAATNATPVLSEAETCIDAEGVRVPLAEEALAPFEGAPKQSQVGSFQLGEACPDHPGSGNAICIPPGAYVLGSSDKSENYAPSVPERFAVMNRFWMDRTEVTVARWRAALSRNFRSPNLTPVENNGPLSIDLSTDARLLAECTYSASAGSVAPSREDFPLTCVDWYAARAFCQFQGGDLPTEAQWEYVASKAGRSFETRFPWGDQTEAPTCDQAVFFRRGPDSLCASKGVGPIAVTDTVVQRDATPLGVLDLAGNVDEWTLDSANKYDSPCWNGSTLTDPVCWEENAPQRRARGGTWTGTATTLAASFGVPAAPIGSCYSAGYFGNGHIAEPLCLGWTDAGFRCVYRGEPK